MINIKDIPEMIFAAEEKRYRPKSPMERPGLGASEVEILCERALFYSFRRCTKDAPHGRLIRLFSRGQQEEDRVVDALRKIGLKTVVADPKTGKQFHFTAMNGMLSGSADGFVEINNKRYLLEIKTMKESVFNQVKKHGLEKNHEQYIGQVQTYMNFFNVEKCLFVCVNKNNDDIYVEEVSFSETQARLITEKVERVTRGIDPGARIGGPAYFKCKICKHFGLCHGVDRLMPEISCRSCSHFTLLKSGWACSKLEKTIKLKDTDGGASCIDYMPIPELLDGWARHIGDNRFEVKAVPGRIITVSIDDCIDDDMFTPRQLARLTPQAMNHPEVVRIIKATDGAYVESEKVVTDENSVSTPARID